MKLSFKIILSLIFVACILSCTENEKKIDQIDNSTIFKENQNTKRAKSDLKIALIKNEILSDKVISDSQTAVSIAESILFKIYGKENIIKQRPYNVNFVEDYYVINGTMPSELAIRGTFLIIINSKDGKVIKLTHGK